MRCLDGMPNLRGMKTYPVVVDAIRESSKKKFRICHFAVEPNQYHLFIEADSTEDISEGMKGLNCRITRAVNKLHHRRGMIWADRYHAHECKGRMETRNVLAYVLLQHQHHDREATGIDRCSSGFWFRDWGPPPMNVVPPVVPPQTWLANIGWRLTWKGRFLPSPDQY
jgi:REP element-mobilizing transposase RayT